MVSGRGIRAVGGALLATVLVTLAAAGPASAGQAAPPAPALGGVRIVAIYFDPPGPDNRTNRSLNGEWVQLRNVTGSRKVITGWTLHDASIHRYTFPPTVMGPGARLRVHTGFGLKNPWNRYWRSANYIWNNTGDRATLRNARGTIVSRCAYTKANDPIKHC